MFSETLTTLSTTTLMLGSMLAGVAIAHASRLISKKKPNSLMQHNSIGPKQDRHWIQGINNPMLVFNQEGNILFRNHAFEALCPEGLNFELLNQVHHYLPQINLAYGDKPQGPMTLLDQRKYHWQVYCFQETQYRHILQLIPYKIATRQHLSNETIQVMQQIMLSMSHETRNSLVEIREAIQKMALMHDFTSERAQFFARKFNLECTDLHSYFDQHQFNNVISDLKKATFCLNEQLNQLSPAKNLTYSKKKKFSSKETIVKAIEHMLETKAATYLTHQGFTPIHFEDTTENNIEFIGDAKIFIGLLTAVYEWVALPLFDQLNILIQKCQNTSLQQKCAVIHLKVCHENSVLSIIFQGHFIEGHSPLRQIPAKNPEDYTRSSTTITEGFLAFIQLQNLFQMEILTEINSDDSNQISNEHNLNIFELTLSFPTNLALNTRNLKQKFKPDDNKISMRDDPITIEFLEALSHDVDTITIKSKKKDITIH